MNTAKKAAAALALVLAIFLFITWRALEGQEVVVLRTFGTGGAVRETRTWVADEDGYVWIESANAERPFYRHILGNPRVELVRNGSTSVFMAKAVPNPQGHLRIRRLLAEKYRWADRWIGMLTDTSGSVAIRLEPPSEHVYVPRADIH